MKCYLHIGTEKTATTTLQRFFHKNREKLLELGYCYTRSAGPQNNIELAIAAYNADRRDEFTRARGIETAGEMTRYQANVLGALKQELKNLKFANAIFSSEHFQSRLSKVEEVNRLKEILLALGFTEINVIVYLRDPAHTANSAYSTAVKGGSTALHPPDPTGRYYENLCNHRATLEKFGNVFGMESLQPRIFERDFFVNGSILEDFLAQLGCAIDRDYYVPEDENESISATGLELLRRINHRIPSTDRGRPNPLRRNLISYFEKHYVDDGDRYSMPSHLWEKYDEAFALSNEWVRNIWFPERQFLFEPKKMVINAGLPTPSEELDRFANFFSDAWIDMHEKLLSLEEGVYPEK